MQPETLPDGWTEVRFDQMASTFSKRVDPAEAEVDVYVGLEHIEPESLRIKEYGVPSDVKGQKLRFRPGHIIFGKRRAYQRKLAVAEVDGICSAHAMVLEAQPDVVHPDFLPFWMQSDLFMDRAVQISVGGLSPTINWKTLRKQTFALPPMDRQRELVEVFRGVEDVIIRQEDALDAARRLVRSVRNDLFTPEPDWRTVRLGEIAEVQLGKMLSPAAKTGEHYHPYLRAANIKRGEIDFSDLLEMDFDEGDFAKFVLRPGDILLAEGNANPEYLGDPSLYTEAMPEGMCFQKTLVRVRTESEDALPSFVYHALRYLYETGVFLGIARGTDMKHITAIRTSKLKMSLPSVEAQREIVAHMTELEAAVESLRQHGNKTQRLKRGLLTSSLAPSEELTVAA